MQVLISDANILIDMDVGGLIESLFQLPYQLKVSDLLFHDELAHYHGHLLDLGLELQELTPDSMREALRLTNTYRDPSRYDCFSLALAKQEACPLLTGDKSLRKAAKKEAVIVMGTIWLVEEMVTHNIIDKTAAALAYSAMEAAGSRLPWAEARKRLAGL